MNRALLILLFLLAACGANEAADNTQDANFADMVFDENASDPGANLAASDANAAATIDEGNAMSIETGTGAFIQPEDMEVGHWQRLEFVLGTRAEAVAAESGGRPLGEVQPVFVTPSMRVTLLRDENFEVRQLGDPVKKLGLDKAASWQWNVKPLADGSHELIAKVEILRVGPDGRVETLDDYTRRVAIDVKVGTWQGFLNALKNAQTLGDALGTLFRSWEKTLLALAGLIAAAFLVVRTIRKKRA